MIDILIPFMVLDRLKRKHEEEEPLKQHKEKYYGGSGVIIVPPQVDSWEEFSKNKA